MTAIYTFLMFGGRAEEAVNTYASLFPSSRIVEVRRHGEENPGQQGVSTPLRFELSGVQYRALDSAVHHALGTRLRDAIERQEAQAPVEARGALEPVGSSLDAGDPTTLGTASLARECPTPRLGRRPAADPAVLRCIRRA